MSTDPILTIYLNVLRAGALLFKWIFPCVDYEDN